MENLTPAEVLENATQALNILDFENAEKFLNYGLKQNPYSAEIHLGFAQYYFLQRNLEGALFWGQKAKELATDRGDAVALIAACYLAANQVGRAIEALEKALADSPGHPELLGGLGKALNRAGRHEEALPHLRNALEGTQAPELVHYDLALAYAESAQNEAHIEKAVDHLTSSIETNPSFPLPYFLLSQLSVRLDLLDQAIEVLSDGLAYNPNMPALRENLHELYLMKQDPEQAMVQAMELVAFRGAPTDYMRVGNTALLTQDFKGAVVAYKQAQEGAPDDPGPVLNLAHVHRVQKKRKQAIKYYREASRLAPDSHKPFLGMGLVYLELDEDYSLSRETLLAAAKIAPDNFDVCLYLAVCAQKTGDRPEIENWAQRALENAASANEQERAQALLPEGAV